ncbi:uncharacterized protein BX664DRAFT_320901 [Halteromyces radiatus]|uniref:uncharacterized protein n=1 Tax=Halteromyces radiatus TaxID=101107 RepID=UPI002220366E|nr:uncharacterized protein BX664DRAFT_320901 [Halteromyces radiatus]KAI8099277.1 hypothetical protein BX664DRAFT_320901 [Halteromyces radiatus]
MVDNISALHSNIDPNSLVHKGKNFDHLRKVNDYKVKELIKQLKLTSELPLIETLSQSFPPNSDDVRAEQTEETQLLNSGQSKVKDLALSITPAVSLELQLGFAKMTINLDKVIDELGISVAKLAIGIWGGARTRNAPDITVFGYYLPLLKPFINLGQPMSYESYEIFSEGELLLTNPSVTFEYWTTTMPIFNAIVFCGRAIGASDLSAGTTIRSGFIHGLLPVGAIGIGRMQALNFLSEIVNELWIKGGSGQDDPMWQEWSKKFVRSSGCKATVIRDLVRLAKEGNEAALQVSDICTAAVAFGLAQVNLCKIMALDFGSGPRIYRESDSGFKGLKLEASVRENSYIPYPYDERSIMFRSCGVPEESLEVLVNWLDNEIANTTLLGIENGDPPGTVIMVPSFWSLVRTGAIKSLGPMVKRIGMDIAENCMVCEGSCTSLVHKASLGTYVGCRTVLFLNMLVSVYVGGVLKKAGMAIDLCLLAGDLPRTVKSLWELSKHDTFGLASFLTSWYVLRSGEEAPHMDYGTVLGLEMDGQIHGLRNAVKPGTTGSPLVSFGGHIQHGAHTFACLVFGERNELRHDLSKAHLSVIKEQPPDVTPAPALFVRPEPNYIAVDTFLIYSGEEQLQVDLGAYVNMTNVHRCGETAVEMAVPLQVSQCVNGYSVVDLHEAFRFVLYTYGKETLQSWIYGAFPPGTAWFQGCRPLHAALALVGPGEILIQGGRKNLIKE